MARRRTKKRTQPVQNASTNTKNGAAAMNRSPKSMVIRIGAGEVGSSVSQLVQDFRLMMEPDTASRLKERRANKLKDYITMAGPLGVTHLVLFSKSSTGNTNMRLALTPRGPTLHFKVEKYSLCKDVAQALKRPRGGGQDHRTPPLLVMNNFNNPDVDENSRIPKRLESLTTTVFQSLFPPINPQATPLASIRRVMLLNREKTSSTENPGDDPYILSLRHYAITTKKTGIPRRIRRLDPTEQRHSDKNKGLPNLGKLEDVADYLLDPASGGYTSASETELDTDAEVEIAGSTTKKVLNKRDLQRMKAGEKRTDKQTERPNVEKRVVKLVELGPRMKLRLMKVEEGLCDGRIMWHDFISKSDREIKRMDDEWNRRRKVKEERKRQQKANVEKKKQDKAKAQGNGEAVDDEADDDEDMDDEWDSDDYDEDAEVEQDGDEDDDQAMEE